MHGRSTTSRKHIYGFKVKQQMKKKRDAIVEARRKGDGAAVDNHQSELFELERLLIYADNCPTNQSSLCL